MIDNNKVIKDTLALLAAKLRNGDIVKNVAGNEIKSLDELISFFNDLQSKDSVSYQVLRRGREHNIDLNIK